MVGVGQGVNTTELEHIAGDSANAYTAASFNELISGDFVTEVRDKGCEAGRLKFFTCSLLLLSSTIAEINLASLDQDTSFCLIAIKEKAIELVPSIF